MAKIKVTRKPGGSGVPFLKGILVQSLLEAGVPFKDAYDITQVVRKGLESGDVVSTSELKTIVATLLEKDYGEDLRRSYEAGLERNQEIIVKSRRGEHRFSSEILTHSLEACSLDSGTAHKVAEVVENNLRASGSPTLESTRLQDIVYEVLREHAPKRIAKYYLSRVRFRDSGDPLIVLIGGATGTGKSTVSTELAYRLDILRSQSTDMMREIIRSYLAPHLVPTLGYSSFEAWRGLSTELTSTGSGIANSIVVEGFLNQFADVRPALEATIARAVKERQHIIIEGVHLLPELDLVVAGDNAVVVPVMLAVTNKQRLAEHIAWRSSDQPDRDSSRYLKQLEAIWDLQSFLLGKADKAGIPVIANWTLEDTVWEVLREVNRSIRKRYPARRELSQ